MNEDNFMRYMLANSASQLDYKCDEIMAYDIEARPFKAKDIKK